MRITLLASLAGALALAVLGAGEAVAHVAPSPTDNNRYLKLTLQGDRARLSYTVFFGDRPGAAERMRMDRNGNGLIEDDEAHAFGADLLAQVAPAVTFELDGQPVTAKWKLTDVGLGLAQVSGGAFAVDLAVEAPTGATAGAHTLWIDDRFKLPMPGDTEIRVEESPGVRAVAAHLGRDGQGLQLRYAFRGEADKPGERGVRVDYSVDAEAARAATASSGDDGQSPPPPVRTGAAGGARRHGRALWLALGALGLGAIVVAVMGLRRKAGGGA